MERKAREDLLFQRAKDFYLMQRTNVQFRWNGAGSSRLFAEESKQPEFEVLYREAASDGEKEGSLREFLQRERNQSFFIVGDSGSGKTMSLLQAEDAYYADDSSEKVIVVYLEAKQLLYPSMPYVWRREDGRPNFLEMILSQIWRMGKENEEESDLTEEELQEELYERKLGSQSPKYLFLLDDVQEIFAGSREEEDKFWEALLWYLRKASNLRMVLGGYVFQECFCVPELKNLQVQKLRDAEVEGQLREAVQQKYLSEEEQKKVLSAKRTGKLWNSLRMPCFLRMYIHLSTRENVISAAEILQQFFWDGVKQESNEINRERYTRMLEEVLPKLAFFLFRKTRYFFQIEELTEILKPEESEEKGFLGLENEEETDALFQTELVRQYNRNSACFFTNPMLKDYFTAVALVQSLRRAAKETDWKEAQKYLRNLIVFGRDKAVFAFAGELLGLPHTLPYFEGERWNLPKNPNPLFDEIWNLSRLPRLELLKDEELDKLEEELLQLTEEQRVEQDREREEQRQIQSQLFEILKEGRRDGLYSDLSGIDFRGYKLPDGSARQVIFSRPVKEKKERSLYANLEDNEEWARKKSWKGDFWKSVELHHTAPRMLTQVSSLNGSWIMEKDLESERIISYGYYEGVSKIGYFQDGNRLYVVSMDEKSLSLFDVQKGSGKSYELSLRELYDVHYDVEREELCLLGVLDETEKLMGLAISVKGKETRRLGSFCQKVSPCMALWWGKDHILIANKESLALVEAETKNTKTLYSHLDRKIRWVEASKESGKCYLENSLGELLEVDIESGVSKRIWQHAEKPNEELLNACVYKESLYLLMNWGVLIWNGKEQQWQRPLLHGMKLKLQKCSLSVNDNFVLVYEWNDGLQKMQYRLLDIKSGEVFREEIEEEEDEKQTPLCINFDEFGVPCLTILDRKIKGIFSYYLEEGEQISQLFGYLFAELNWEKALAIHADWDERRYWVCDDRGVCSYHMDSGECVEKLEYPPAFQEAMQKADTKLSHAEFAPDGSCLLLQLVKRKEEEFPIQEQRMFWEWDWQRQQLFCYENTEEKQRLWEIHFETPFKKRKKKTEARYLIRKDSEEKEFVYYLLGDKSCLLGEVPKEAKALWFQDEKFGGILVDKSKAKNMGEMDLLEGEWIASPDAAWMLGETELLYVKENIFFECHGVLSSRERSSNWMYGYDGEEQEHGEQKALYALEFWVNEDGKEEDKDEYENEYEDEESEKKLKFFEDKRSFRKLPIKAWLTIGLGLFFTFFSIAFVNILLKEASGGGVIYKAWSSYMTADERKIWFKSNVILSCCALLPLLLSYRWLTDRRLQYIRKHITSFLTGAAVLMAGSMFLLKIFPKGVYVFENIVYLLLLIYFIQEKNREWTKWEESEKKYEVISGAVFFFCYSYWVFLNMELGIWSVEEVLFLYLTLLVVVFFYYTSMAKLWMHKKSPIFFCGFLLISCMLLGIVVAFFSAVSLEGKVSQFGMDAWAKEVIKSAGWFRGCDETRIWQEGFLGIRYGNWETLVSCFALTLVIGKWGYLAGILFCIPLVLLMIWMYGEAGKQRNAFRRGVIWMIADVFLCKSIIYIASNLGIWSGRVSFPLIFASPRGSLQFGCLLGLYLCMISRNEKIWDKKGSYKRMLQ